MVGLAKEDMEVNMTGTTSLQHQCDILADVWMKYRAEGKLEDFISYNDLGLPLAWATAEGLAQLTDTGIVTIEETFAMFLKILDVEDTGFNTLDEILIKE